MCSDFPEVERLIVDLKSEDLLERHVVEDGIVKINTAKFLLIIYYPSVGRIADIADKKVIHIDVDVLKNDYDKVWKRIKSLSGIGQRIYARQTVVARIDKAVSVEFLEEYHLNGSLSGKYRYGLFYNGELVSVAVFSGGRVMRAISDTHRSFELLRFCHKADYLVVGGISKLVKGFIADFKPNDIMTYSDRDWSQQSALEAIGFVEESITESQVFHVKDGKRLAFSDDTENYDYAIKNKGSIKLKLYV